MATTHLKVFDFNEDDPAIGDPNAVKSFYGSGKGKQFIGSYSKPKNSRTILEDMIFNGKIPAAAVGKEVMSNDISQELIHVGSSSGEASYMHIELETTCSSEEDDAHLDLLSDSQHLSNSSTSPKDDSGINPDGVDH